MAYGISQLEDRDWTFKQSVTIQGDFTFGNAATDTLTVTGDYTQTYAGTADGFIVSGTGAQTAGNDLARFTSIGSLSSTSNVVAIEQSTGAGTAGAYGLYINCTGTNVEALKVDAGAVVFDETLLVTGVLTSDGNVSLGAGSDLLGSATSDITINTTAFTVAGATGNTSVGGTFGATGLSTLTGGATVGGTLIQGGTGAITATSGAGAVAVTGQIHQVTTTGTGDALTLANGTAGQRLCVLYVAEGAGGDTAVITPTTLAGGTTITLTNLGDSCDLVYSATGGWYVLGLGGAAAVA